MPKNNTSQIEAGSLAMAGAALALRPAVWALHCLLGRPRDSMLAIIVAGSVGAIAFNGLMLQQGPHPAPIFAHVIQNPPPGLMSSDVLVRRNNDFVPPGAAAPPAQRAAVSEEPTGALPPMLPRARPPEAPPKIAPAATRPAAMRKDPIGDMIGPPQPATPAPQAAPPQSAPMAAAPTTQVAAAPLPAALPQPAVATSSSTPQTSPQIASVQRVLGSFGYLQMSPNGIMGPETKRAIEEFERERRLPVTGQVSDRLVRELSVVTGKPL